MDSYILLDYPTLRFIWWGLLGALMIGFAILGGIDIGAASLLTAVARTDAERRVLLNVMGPTWEGNQVWLITAGGVIFAAWPLLYAASFSGLYIAMLLVLLTLILRPVGFKFRSKLPDPRWRAFWDWALCIGGAVLAILFGVALGNVVQGIPFNIDDTMRPSYHGSFWGLINPFGLVAGLLSLAMLIGHGAVLLAWRTEGEIERRAVRYGSWAFIATVLLFILGGVMLTMIPGYQVTSVQDLAAPSNPLLKTVAATDGGWLAAYDGQAWRWIFPALGLAGTVLAWLLMVARSPRLAFIASSLGIAGILLTFGVNLFPFILPSSFNPGISLTVWDASSSHSALWIMLLVTIVFLPIIIVYTAWVYRVMGGTVTRASVERDAQSY